jgi:hypothetical protein
LQVYAASSSFIDGEARERVQKWIDERNVSEFVVIGG